MIFLTAKCDDSGGATRATEVLGLSEVCQTVSLTLDHPVCLQSFSKRNLLTFCIFCLAAPCARQGTEVELPLGLPLGWIPHLPV